MIWNPFYIQSDSKKADQDIATSVSKLSLSLQINYPTIIKKC